MMDRELEHLCDISARSATNHLHSRNMIMLEAVISAILDVSTPQEAAVILREHADQLEEYL